MVEIDVIIKLKAMGHTPGACYFKLLLIIKNDCFQLPKTREKT